ncbi:methyltransferase domain-containing protein [Candidatus Woesearchaeota archaeon]|nr:methyltransferase domain-containing protein [Candidatus Woesearchaeota archaeon]
MTGWDKDRFVHYWKHYLPPARPSESELEFFRKKISERKGEEKPKVLILGSTIEFRNLCSELGAEVICLDFSRYNYDYLSKDVKEKDNFAEGSWTDTVLDERFDFILGDNVINVIPKEDAERLLRNCSKMLKPEGRLMLRTDVREKGERYTPEEAVKGYENLPPEEFYSFVTIRLHLAVYDFDKDYAVIGDVWKAAKDLHDRGIITESQLDMFTRMSYKDRDFRFFIPLKEWFEDVASGIVDIDDIGYGTEAFLKRRHPIYVLKLK